ncbi:MAG: hypothetical protein WCF18_24830 [Chthoniobacteraceae bacterium]
MAVLLAIISGIVSAWLSFDRWQGRREWDRYRAEALARGVKMTLLDFAPPVVAPEENYAVGTIFERAGSEPADQAVHKRPLKLPQPKKPNPRAALAERIEAAKSAMIEAGWLKAEGLPPEAGRAVLLGLERFRAPLDELRAARSRPRNRFLQSALPPPQTAFPQLMVAMDVAAVLALRSDASLAVGEVSAAREDIVDGLRLYRAMIDEPTMISALGRLTVLHVLMRSIDLGLAGELWREDDLRQIESFLGEIDLAADARRAFSSERGFVNDASIARGRLPLAEQVAQVESMDVTEELPQGWRLWWSLACGDQWRRLVLENRVLDHRLNQFQAGFDRAFDRPPPDDPASKITLSSMTDMFGKQYAVREMALRETRVAMALARFRIARGAYPDSLGELVPAFIGAIPADIIDGAPVRYRRVEADKFLLYSVGANGRDDGGSAVLASGPAAGAFKALDWVWSEPWK